MNNFIEYFYGIKVDKIVYEKNSYSFIYNKYFYKLAVNCNTICFYFLYNYIQTHFQVYPYVIYHNIYHSKIFLRD